MRDLKDIAPGLYMMMAFLEGDERRGKGTHVEALLKGTTATYLKSLGTPTSAIEAIIALTSRDSEY
ncbi:MAG: hypothetical protein J7L55_00400 [Desulfurococcales archaeon]|nr:hypothetical protein [Desulfurococcales archaeon]